MSVEQVKAFFAKVNEDDSLAQQLKDAQAAYTGEESDKEAAIAAIFVSVAAQAGFNFTVEDFKEVFDNNEEGETSAEELKAVAGGGDYLTFIICREPQCAAEDMYLNSL
ncbi:MAG: Nif11-like leader peptide family RiPP precursor [Synergistaceae bacterium]|nr:Nif11-like leader peptide family RiPP precursor [Synergistaceae bacterium]